MAGSFSRQGDAGLRPCLSSTRKLEWVTLAYAMHRRGRMVNSFGVSSILCTLAGGISGLAIGGHYGFLAAVGGGLVGVMVGLAGSVAVFTIEDALYARDTPVLVVASWLAAILMPFLILTLAGTVLLLLGGLRW